MAKIKSKNYETYLIGVFFYLFCRIINIMLNRRCASLTVELLFLHLFLFISIIPSCNMTLNSDFPNITYTLLLYEALY